MLEMPYLKALHIIGVVVWFSGLFYIGRLFVYHQEAESQPPEARQLFKTQFALMEKRLWYAITWPGCVVTVIFGLSLIHPWLSSPWLHLKLGMVVCLLAYHWQCGRLRQQLAEGQCQWSSKQLRAFNEIPSLLLIGIVFVVVLKEQLSWIKLALIVGGMAVIIGIAMKIYQNVRHRNPPPSKESRP